MHRGSPANYWVFCLIIIALILSGWLFAAFPNPLGQITVLSYVGMTVVVLALVILAANILVYGARKIQMEKDGMESMRTLIFPQSVNEWVTVFLQLAITVFLVVATAYLGTKAIHYIGAIDSGMIALNSSAPQGASNDGFNNQSDGSLLGILSIMGIFGGVLAYVFNAVIRREIEVKYEKLGEEGRHFTEAQMLKTGGLTEYYKFTIQRDNPSKSIDPTKHNLILLKALNNAIYFTGDGIRILSQLDGEAEKKERNELLMCILKNNFAWMYVEKLNFISHEFEGLEGIKQQEELDCIKEKIRVSRYIQYVYNRIHKHSTRHTIAWIDTYNEVKQKFPLK